MDCSWDNPGVDPYTGTARAAIMSYAQIPEPVRLRLVERAEAKVPRYDDAVEIDRDAIRGFDQYLPALREMHFGAGKRCATVSRDKWDPKRRERAMVFCEGDWCVARPSVCNNWSLITRVQVAKPVAFGAPPADDVLVFDAPGAGVPPAAAQPPADIVPPAETPPTFMTFAYGPPTAIFFPWVPPTTGTPPTSTPPTGGPPPIVVPPEVSPPPLTPPVTAVPEPSTYALFGAGLAAILFIRRRRSRAS